MVRTLIEELIIKLQEYLGLGKDAQLLHDGFDVRGVTSVEAMSMKSLGDVLGLSMWFLF